MLETIREYAAEQLAAHGEESMMREAHAAWCLALAEEAAPYWFTPDQAVWGDRLDAEHDNLLAALARVAEEGGTGDGVRLAGRLWPFWFVRGHFAEGLASLDRAVTWRSADRTIERVRVLTGASCMVRQQGDEPLATVYGEEALRIAEEIGAGTGIDAVHALIGLALTASIRQDLDLAMTRYEQILAVLRDLSDSEPSAAHVERLIIVNLAWMALEQGDDERATRLAEDGLAHQREHGFTWGEADSLFILALVAQRRGDLACAAALLRTSLGLASSHRDPQQIVSAVDRLALLASETGYAEEGARLIGAVERLYERLGLPPAGAERQDAESAALAIRQAIGEVRYETAVAAGRSIAFDEFVGEAMALAKVIASSDAGPEQIPSDE